MNASASGHIPSEEKLSGAERRLVAAAAKGTMADLRTGDAEADDPKTGAKWGTGRQIRAELLTELLTGQRNPGGRPARIIKLTGARITGSLDLEAATLTCPLVLQDCYFDEAVNLNEATAPAIRLPGCHLPGLKASQLRTSGDLELRRTKFTTNSEVNLLDAHIGGALDLRGASLSNPGARALWADSLTVGQNLLCWGHFAVLGEVQLRGAHVGGRLDLRGASLSNPGGRALRANRLTVGHNLVCSDGFAAVGEVGLSGAHIGGQLRLEGASLSNPDGAALAADRLTIEEDLICCDGFKATGEVRLTSASIGRQLDLHGATLSNPGGNALTLDRANVTVLSLLPQQRPDGVVSLANATVVWFNDDPATWPATFDLQQFKYDILGNGQVSPHHRLEWLGRHRGGYAPQLYDQLASTYQRAGDERAARTVAIAKQRRRRRKFSPLSWLWYLTVGYGYRPWLAGAWVIALAALGTAVFSHAYPAHMTATSPHPPAFHAAAYTLDLLLPVIGLGQKSAWHPQSPAYQYWSWALTGAGWVMTTALVTGLSGILKRD
jgi:hypothetical protein